MCAPNATAFESRRMHKWTTTTMLMVSKTSRMHLSIIGNYFGIRFDYYSEKVKYK